MFGLTLSRRPGEQIVCMLPDGEEIVITCGKIRRDQVRLMVLAPQSVAIVRAELLAGDRVVSGQLSVVGSEN
jgi:carbon storage regulator CsrA